MIELLVNDINKQLQRTLSHENLQLSVYWGLSNTMVKTGKGSSQSKVEKQPAVYNDNGKLIPVAPDDKLALQIYHKVKSKTYSREKAGYGDDVFFKCVADIGLYVFVNNKLTTAPTEFIESLFAHSFPGSISRELQDAIKLYSVQITPSNSVLESSEVFAQEYPNANYFLNEQMSMLLIRYKIETKYTQTCINKCLCIK